LTRYAVYEVIMTVRRTFNEQDIPYELGYFVENHLAEDPENFLAGVSRSDIDWEWGRVPT